MKTTIILTDEQIAQLTKVETEYLIKEKNKKIEEIEKEFENSLSKLIKKYKTYTIDINVDEQPEKESTKLTDERLTQYFNDGKSIKEMSELSGKTEQQIRAKLNRLGLKIRDRK